MGSKGEELTVAVGAIGLVGDGLSGHDTCKEEYEGCELHVEDVT